MNKDASPPTAGLTGKRIVVTRARHQAAELTDLLLEYGADLISYPCIDIVPPEDTAPLDAALQEAAAGQFDWMYLTSANTVTALSRRVEDLDRYFGGLKIAAIGSKTAAAAQDKLRIEVNLTADAYTAESLAVALHAVTGQRILLPQSNIAQPVMAQLLRVAGAEVTVVEAYRTVMGTGGDDVPALLNAGRIDAITFTSSSTVRNFLSRLEKEGGQLSDLEGVCLAAIGPITAGTMRDLALPVNVMAVEYTAAVLVEALADHYH
jgi:uroporphyrinogen-III synthase